MEVEVRLFGGFREGRFNRRVTDLTEGTSLGGLIQQLGIPQKEVAMPLVNGRHSEPDRKLTDGDVVSLLPAVGGG